MIRGQGGSPGRSRGALTGAAVAVLLLAAVAAGACSPSGGGNAHGPIRVVAAENFWGSIAAQLGGTKVSVRSIIANPATDPHDYEPTVADGRTIAESQLMIENDIGYDTWAARALAANPDPSRRVVDVGRIAGLSAGANPHQWYSPTVVRDVIAAIAADYEGLDPADAAYFRRQRLAYETHGLARYDALIAQIRSRYAGVPIGASESIVTPLAQALGLDLLTPRTFLDAISEGSEPSAADKATIDHQILTKRIKIFVYNVQNSTPDVTALVAEARAEGIPVVKVTETMVPANGTFQGWQTAQLAAIAAALHTATGR